MRWIVPDSLTVLTRGSPLHGGLNSAARLTARVGSADAADPVIRSNRLYGALNGACPVQARCRLRDSRTERRQAAEARPPDRRPRDPASRIGRSRVAGSRP